MEHTDLADRIIQRLTDYRAQDTAEERLSGWLTADQLLDLAPLVERPVYAYRHELDDADSGETMAFGDDATGLASSRPVRTEQRPDRDLILSTLRQLAAEGRIEHGVDHGRLVGEFRAPRAEG